MVTALTIAFAELAGFVVLLPACLLRAWTPATIPSTKPLPGRQLVDTWRWRWLRPWYANVEDGVSGQQARVWNAGGTALVPYASTFPAWVPQWAIAYGWSAWRNGANNAKRPLRVTA